MRRILILLAMSTWPFAQALASPALTTSPTTMYATSSPGARVIQAIPANAEIDVSNCGRAWCYASWRNRFGYVSARTIEASPDDYPPPEPYGPPPVVAPPYYGPYFGWGWGWGPGWHRW